jgi:SAM-dependent methyltransferase
MNSISDLIAQPWSTFVLFAAVRLKLFSILGDREMRVEEIGGACGAPTHMLRALLDACVAMGLFTRQGDRYVNTPFSLVYLVEGKPFYMGDFFDLLNAESARWHGLPNLIGGTRQPGEEESKKSPDSRTFIKAMNNLGMLGEAEALKNAVDLSGRGAMVDAGGGSGLYSVVLCREYPDLRSTILDVKEVLAVAQELTKECEERERIGFREADIMADPFGANIDVVLLSDVVYDKSDADAILRNAWHCLRPDGLLVVRGYYADPPKTDPLWGSLFVLNMLVFDPTREVLTVSSLEQIVSHIGFTDIRVAPLTERSTCLTARKP